MAQIAAREALFAALATRLATRLAGVTVERNRTDAVEPVDCPRVVLSDGDQVVEPPEGMGVGLVRIRIRCQIAGYVSAATVAAMASAANDLHARAVAAAICDSVALSARPVPLLLGIAPNQAEGWVEELGTRFGQASIEQSDTPFAAFVSELSIALDLPEGAPFLDV